MSPRSLFKQLKNERLSPDEKKQMLAAIVEAQRQFPARQVTASTRWAFWQITPVFRLALTTLSVLVVIAASGSTALAAESALPGDMLYSIKIDINERALAVLAISVESKAALEERLAERRLEELEKMVETNRLTAEHEAKVTAQFDAHKTEMGKNIARLEATGKTKQAATLRVRLNDFIEAKEAKILNDLNIKLKQEIIRQEKMERLEEKQEQKSKELKKQKKDERESVILKTEIAVPASIEVKNQLKIKIEKQREERRLEQEEKREKQQEEKSKESEERETVKEETKSRNTTPAVHVDTSSEIKIEVKEKSLVAPVINRLGL